MNFLQFQKLVVERFNFLSQHKLFVIELPPIQTLEGQVNSGYQLCDIYLDNFKEGDNPVFRDPESSEHNCNLDKHFIRRYGNVVAIINNKVETLWNLGLEENNPYYAPCKALNEALLAHPIKNVFFETFEYLHKSNYEKTNNKMEVYRIGMQKSDKTYTQEEADKFGAVEAGKLYTFNHLFVNLPKAFVDFSGKSVESIQSDYRSAKEVFKRGLDEIHIDTFILVRDLINQGSLLNGESYLDKLVKFIEYKRTYDTLSTEQKDVWCWLTSYKLPFAKFRNELIGTLCVELTEGKELNEACKTWNQRVDPTNYMKAKAPITETQRKEAVKIIQELGYEESFNRRLVKLSDIDIELILHKNDSLGSDNKTASIFDKVVAAPSTRHKRSQFDNVETVTIDNFMSKILPNATSVEVFVENRFDGNFVVMHTAEDPSCKLPFKWSNPFGYTFKGNLAGKSMIKEAVKTAGGTVDAFFRCSLIWNQSGLDNSDLDLWCQQPDGTKIGYSSGYRKDRGNNFTSMSGQLDLDNTGPGRSLGIENLYFTTPSKLKDGVYKFWVNQFSNRNSQGFQAEIEVDGEIYSYSYEQPLFSGNVPLAEVTLKDGNFTIKHFLPESNSSKKMWNIETNQFVKANLVCLSPNFWGENNFGNKHYLFMLDGCKVDEPIKGFHAEFLNQELSTQPTRKFVDIFGNFHQIEPSNKDHLAGIGFNATVRESLIVKVKGSFERVVKIQF